MYFALQVMIKNKRVKKNMNKKVIICIILAIVVYLVIGMLAPFAVQKKIEPEDGTFQKDAFYASANEKCVDRAHIVEENAEALDLRLRMIKEAKERVILSTFDFREDKSTWDLGAALYEAAERGVQIQIMVDGISGILRMERNPFFYALSGHENIEIRLYNYPNLLKPWTFHGRMHDKYVISDNKTLLLGGRNTFRYFLGGYDTKSRSYDREVLIYNTDYKNGTEKSVISQVEKYFRSIWDGPYMTVFHDGEKVNKKKKVVENIRKLEKRWGKVQKQYPQAYEEYSYEEHTVPIKKATLISGETGIYGKKPYVWNTLKELMAHAEKKVVFHTPYVVLDSAMEDGIREIAENVNDFTMVINSVANGDNIVASSDYLIHKKDILKTGVQLYEFDGGDSTHGKSILIDDDMAIIGSYNLDMRSTYMDTELMLAIHGEEFAEELKGCMDFFMEKSIKVLDAKNYENPEEIKMQEIPFMKKVVLRIAGPLLQLVRYLA